jgi:LacI family transcriptional regulator
MVRRISLAAIAARLGCSKNTVSLALRGSREIPPHTRERIRRVAEELGYQPDPLVSQLMAQLRLGQSPRFQAKLALANAHWDRDALRQHPVARQHVRGCEQRAARLGYSFDPFWIHDPELTAARWTRILAARGIKGIIVVGLFEHNQLPAHLASVWEQIPTVVAGVRPRTPSLSYTSVDQYDLTLKALEKALELGYERPALMVDDAMDRLVERRFSAAMVGGQGRLADHQRVPSFMTRHGHEADLKAFYAWFNRYKPDVIITLDGTVVQWLGRLGVSVPRDIGIIQLEWHAGAELAGMDHHSEAAGEAAVDLLVEQLHANGSGATALPRATLIGATWTDGASVARRTSILAPQLLAG